DYAVGAMGVIQYGGGSLPRCGHRIRNERCPTDAIIVNQTVCTTCRQFIFQIPNRVLKRPGRGSGAVIVSQCSHSKLTVKPGSSNGNIVHGASSKRINRERSAPTPNRACI